MRCNGVFEGGGVKGIGHVGAVHGMENAGYQFLDLAGSSAGAIVAALLAAGYNGAELKEIMKNTDYLQFKQEDFLDQLGIPGKALSVAINYGIFNASYFEKWIQTLLEKKNCTQFKDVKKADGSYRLRVTTSDLTEKQLIVLPDDLVNFKIDPDTFPIAKAVRMSMSIPFFYEPYKLKDEAGKIHYMVDGGMLSNYPIWILDDGQSIPDYPTFGFRFTSESVSNTASIDRMNIVEYVKAVISTLLDASDKIHISESQGDYQRTILIPSVIKEGLEEKNISTTDFGITQSESMALYKNGYQSAEKFLQTWNFDRWRRQFRTERQFK